MNKHRRTAQWLIGLGCFLVLAGSGLHLIAAYPRVSAALTPSNLDAGLKNALRAVFAMIGLSWIVITVVTLIAAFATTRISKLIVLFCGVALLLQLPIWVGLMGWFIGNELFLIAAAFIVIGGLFLPAVTRQNGMEGRALTDRPSGWHQKRS